jgi:AraC-like DNA-binding protein
MLAPLRPVTLLLCTQSVWSRSVSPAEGWPERLEFPGNRAKAPLVPFLLLFGGELVGWAAGSRPKGINCMELTRFCRRSELPGVEMLSVVDSQRPWRRVSSTFELMISDTWRGQIAYSGALHRVAPGTLFCPGPGESFEISRAASPGSFRVLMIERETFCLALAKHGLSPELLQLNRVIAAIPDEFRTRLVSLLEVLDSDSDAAELESRMQVLIGALATHLAGPSTAQRRAPRALVAELVRKLIHSDEEGSFDLAALSRQVGLSRFQVLRAFKRAYSLPPQTYRLCTRIAQAQRLLALGHRPAYVAAELQFVDQSHFTRHFKRLLRVTPSEYAAAAQRKPAGRRLASAKRPRASPGLAHGAGPSPLAEAV